MSAPAPTGTVPAAPFVPRTPALTVDVLLEIRRPDAPAPNLVLVARRHPPLGWALPGGFVDVGERVETAAAREALEETQLAVTLDALFYVYSDPARDARRHTASVVFTAHADGLPVGADDAAEARIFPLDALPELVFDHGRIVADYLRFRATGERPAPVP